MRLDPLLLVAGGVGAGLAVGMLLRQSRPERGALRPLGAALVGLSDRAASRTAKAIRTEFASIPLNRDAVDAKVDRIIEAVAG